MEVVGQPLGDFVRNGGQMRLVTSVKLSDLDIKAIEDGLSMAEVCEQRLLEEIREGFAEPLGRGAWLLSRLLSSGKLEIKLAQPADRRGLYHEKVGVFLDGNGDYVSFSGSFNESRSALERNYECLHVYPSWVMPHWAADELEHFEAVWGRTAPGVRTYDFPEAARQNLIEVLESAEPQQASEEAPETSNGSTRQLWSHQEKAIARFLEKQRGILAMATGTGKTRVALEIMQKLIESGEVRTVVVSTHGTDLHDQWVDDLCPLAVAQVPPLRVYCQFGGTHEREAFFLEPDGAVLVESKDTLHQALGRLGGDVLSRTLLVYDEVHGLGSAGCIANLEGLSDRIPYRLGLSATPHREYDSEGNEFIARHVGEVVFNYELEDAIRDSILCEFDYLPIEYEPSEEDREKVQRVYRWAAARKAQGEPVTKEMLWTRLASVHKCSEAKLPHFAALLSEHPELLSRSIIFVGTREYGGMAASVVHSHTYRYCSYFAEDDRGNLLSFSKGKIDCLITCHRVAQGIDIPDLRTVVLLASDRARLETIQRIGRCLRSDPDDPDKRAHVVDFVRKQDPNKEELNTDQLRAQWLTEVARARRE